MIVGRLCSSQVDHEIGSMTVYLHCSLELRLGLRFCL